LGIRQLIGGLTGGLGLSGSLSRLSYILGGLLQRGLRGLHVALAQGLRGGLQLLSQFRIGAL
jgi:hypothetical protein